MNKPTRFYSNKQEKNIAKALDGKQTANSGATRFSKGDVRTTMFLIEAKTCTEERKSFAVKKEWLKKNEEEAFSMNKPYSALAIDFGSSENYYIINERLFKKLVNLLQEEDNDDFK